MSLTNCKLFECQVSPGRVRKTYKDRKKRHRKGEAQIVLTMRYTNCITELISERVVLCFTMPKLRWHSHSSKQIAAGGHHPGPWQFANRVNFVLKDE